MASPSDLRGLPRASESATTLPLLQHLKLGREDPLPHARSISITQFDSEQGHISLFSKDRFLSSLS